VTVMVIKSPYVGLILQAFLAAVLFGASAPLAKVLLGEIAPVPLAGFLYLGCGLAMLVAKGFQLGTKSSAAREARIEKADMGWLVGAILAGGILAPIALLWGLKSTPAATASLLLNFEGVATVLIAALVFRESMGRQVLLAVACITIAGIFLSWDPNSRWGFSVQALGIIAACGLWGIDNNLTRVISNKDPRQIVMVKGLCVGTVMLCLSLFLGEALPRPALMLKALALGSVSYGISVLLFVYALRGLGAGRTSALFGTAPLAGAGISFLLFRQFPNGLFFVALPFVIAGMILLLKEKHGHSHFHERVRHDHSHNHDDGHHIHGHRPNPTVDQTHSHLHEHTELAHQHPHLPDIHHRHPHTSEAT